MDNEKKTQHGGISVEIEHIFPIIKRWMYSEKEIFLREIVSNACDACTKVKRLVSLGEIKNIDTDSFRIDVILNKDERTVTVRDNGIGMTKDELEKYLCQIALSGALDFIQKYEGEGDSSTGIIGHFGLGFYSAFMVSDTVDVVSRSVTGGSAVLWSCGGDGNYEMTPDYDGEFSDSHGTAVIMHISEEGEEYLNAAKLREVLDKYCAFIPVEIYFTDKDAEEHECDHDHAEGEECDCCHEDADKPINETEPLWLKNPQDCTDEDYKNFYRNVFHDYKEPLFWIHIRADYPLNFKGILYFPRIANEYESLEGQVKLYYNQVFVADNIKEVIPEYLLMLKGVLDCPELPLNVSRSYLQNNGYVSKISVHIVKKVADKLNSMFNTEREKYESVWRDLKTFVEYGCMRDRKFYDRVKDSVLFEKCSGGYSTLGEYLESAKETHENKVYYAGDKTAQASYISMFENEGMEVVLLDKVLDTQFITTVEMANENVHFARVDAEIADTLKNDGDVTEIPELTELFGVVAPGVKVDYQRLKDTKTPAVLHVDEQSRRFGDMMKMYASAGGSEAGQYPVEATLSLNLSCPLNDRLKDLCSTNHTAAERMGKYIYTLCVMSQRGLSADELKEFLSTSYDMLAEL